MGQKCVRLYPSAPLENKNDDLERGIEKRLSDVNSFVNSTNKSKEMITYCKDNSYKSKKIYKKYETKTTILKSFETIVVIGTTSSSIRLRLTGIGLIAIPISSSIAFGLTITIKVTYKIVMQKYDKYKKQYDKDNQTILSFDKLYRKNLMDNVIYKSEYESLCNIFF